MSTPDLLDGALAGGPVARDLVGVGVGVGAEEGAGGDFGAWDRVRTRLVEGVGKATAEVLPGDLIEITLATVRQAHSRPWTVGLPDPDFAWKPAFARRSLGLAAVRACAEGQFHGPAVAAGAVAERAVDEWHRSGRRQFHWEPWFAGLGAGGRAVVLAEAISWATPLWAAFDWSEVGPCAVLGGGDDLWSCPGAGTVRLKGRCEVRIDAGGPGTTTDLVSLSSGSPGERWREELGFLALVAGLSSSGRTQSGRVTGMWPDTGERRTVTVDEELLGSAADSVVSTVALTCAARTTLVGAAVPS